MTTVNRCKRGNGTFRASFPTEDEAVKFAKDPANRGYHGDIPHLCSKCGFYHLSKPEWIEPQFTPADMQVLEDAGIAVPRRLHEDFRCVVCGSIQRDGMEFLIMPDGSIRCSLNCSITPAR